MKRWKSWKDKNWHAEWKETSWWEGNDLRPPGEFVPPFRAVLRTLIRAIRNDPYTAAGLTCAVLGIGAAAYAWIS